MCIIKLLDKLSKRFLWISISLSLSVPFSGYSRYCKFYIVGVAPFLVLHFSYYILMTFLTMLSVILLSLLMILLSTLIAIRHLICGKNLNWLLNLNLIYEILWTGVKCGLLISILGKLIWFHLTSLITMVLLM